MYLDFFHRVYIALSEHEGAVRIRDGSTHLWLRLGFAYLSRIVSYPECSNDAVIIRKRCSFALWIASRKMRVKLKLYDCDYALPSKQRAYCLPCLIENLGSLSSCCAHLLHIWLVLFIPSGGLDIVCNAIMAGRTASLDGSSHGLLYVMQELNSKPNRREPRGLLTSPGEGELAKRMFNFAPYGKSLCQSSRVLFPLT